MAAAPSFLIIQTAFIGDVILATGVVEKLHQKFPDARIDFLLRKGNEELLIGHPFLRNVIVWDKKNGKTENLLRLIKQVRSTRYDHVINVHRFMSSGLITVFSGAKTVGFDKNPLSLFFTTRKKHILAKGTHEIQRNQSLIEELTDPQTAKPRLYPGQTDYDAIKPYREVAAGQYICVAPTSVWFTKQYPREKWVEFINHPDIRSHFVFLLGAASDRDACEGIKSASKHQHVVNLAGELSFLQSAALMQHAAMNYVNDSAPLHIASSMNTPATAVFCSTVPDFGFGPLSDKSYVVETQEKLSCRPCGLHGFRACPERHFRCALTISREQLAQSLRT